MRLFLLVMVCGCNWWSENIEHNQCKQICADRGELAVYEDGGCSCRKVPSR